MCPDGFVKTGATKDLFSFECVKCDSDNVSAYFHQALIIISMCTIISQRQIETKRPAIGAKIQTWSRFRMASASAKKASEQLRWTKDSSR